LQYTSKLVNVFINRDIEYPFFKAGSIQMRIGIRLEHEEEDASKLPDHRTK